MVSHGLVVRLEAKHGKESEVEAFLVSALPLVMAEPATLAWFAVKFGRSEYGIVDFFPDEAGRAAHLAGPVAKALMAKAGELLASPPVIGNVTALADKLPSGASPGPVAKGILLTFKAKQGKEGEVEQFLRGARALVMEEPKTIAWFAIHFPGGDYGIFDVFSDNAARFAHLTGHVPRELAKHSLTLLGSVPDITLLEILADKLGG